jgi:hypothetical protein
MTATYEETQIRLLAYPIDEKWQLEQDELTNHNNSAAPQHGCCKSRGHKRNAAYKATIIALIGLLITLGSLIAMAVLCPEAHSLLFKRQAGGSGTSNGNGNAFTEHKYWIIIIVVVGMFEALTSH